MDTQIYGVEAQEIYLNNASISIIGHELAVKK
jgi:hypothetical protein